jgi:putrescine transport system ATP-binding protein
MSHPPVAAPTTASAPADAVSREARAIGAVRRSFAPWRDPAAKPLIRFENVTRRFGAVTAVNAVSLDIYPREMFCLLGGSGCGKSTLMRLLAGFEQPDEGRILLDGEDITDMPPHERPVNMMFQSYALFPHLSVADNIAFGLKRAGMSKGEIAARVEKLLAMVQLQGLAARKPDQLSGGQRQRVALARALARQPRVLLLDEPLGALDKKTREETQFELMDLQMELGATFLIVTHDQEEAMVMADRIGVMEAGRLTQIGTPADIYEQPATRAIAAFVGDINLFEAVVQPGNAGNGAAAPLSLAAPAFPQGLATEVPASAISAGQAVTVAVRPEKMRLARGASTGLQAGPNRAEGVVWDIAYLGDWTVFVVKLATGQTVKVSQANAERRVAAPITWDDVVTISFAPDAAVVLTA